MRKRNPQIPPTSYRGYWYRVVQQSLVGRTKVWEPDGQFICYAPDVEDARRVIDQELARLSRPVQFELFAEAA